MRTRFRYTALLAAGLLTVAAWPASAQAPDARLATSPGQEVRVGVGGYRYVEPLAQPISLAGLKLVGDYAWTLSLDARRQWFVEAHVHGAYGDTDYDGFCRPWRIAPDQASPNGWTLGLGPASPCSEGGNEDWYVEGRAMVGRDVIRGAWGLSPHAGIGVRHLSSSIAGITGYRTNAYLYVPVGLTARTATGSRGRLGLTLEYDYLIRGWQTTRQSRFGGGTVSATPTAPAFTIEGFSDVSFEQHAGWAIRASATWEPAGRWQIEPYYIRWSVADSPANIIDATFTVNGVTARQPLAFYEPFNTTNEWGLTVGFRF